MTLHRFFLPGDAFAGNEIAFPEDVAHQIRRVLRLRSGDTVVVLDGTGMEYTVRLALTSDDVRGAIEERRANSAEPDVSLTLYIGMLKGHKFEVVLQKCTEIGVSRFVPVITARSVAQEPGGSRQRRFTAIVREAAEQSGRGVVPAVDDVLPFGEAVAASLAVGPVLLLWEGERTHRLYSAAIDARSLALFVGPEGGFEPEEVRQAVTAGARTYSLGPRILRAETAAIAGAALLLA